MASQVYQQLKEYPHFSMREEGTPASPRRVSEHDGISRWQRFVPPCFSSQSHHVRAQALKALLEAGFAVHYRTASGGSKACVYVKALPCCKPFSPEVKRALFANNVVAGTEAYQAWERLVQHAKEIDHECA